MSGTLDIYQDASADAEQKMGLTSDWGSIGGCGSGDDCNIRYLYPEHPGRYIATWPIFNIAVAEERRNIFPELLWWWEQEGIQFGDGGEVETEVKIWS